MLLHGVLSALHVKLLTSIEVRMIGYLMYPWYCNHYVIDVCNIEKKYEKHGF